MRSVDEFFFCVFVREWMGRASGGDREEEQGDVGKWFSRWDLICETVHPKETFSHGPTLWIQIHSATRSELEGRMHLASTRSTAFSLFFFYLNVYFYPITKLNRGDFMEAVMSHPFISLSCNWICLLLFSVMGPRIYNDGPSVCEHVGRNIKWYQWKAAGEFVKGGNVENNQSASVCWPQAYLEEVSCMCVCVCVYKCVCLSTSLSICVCLVSF